MTEATERPWKVTTEVVGLAVSVGTTGTDLDGVTYFITGSDISGDAKDDAALIVRSVNAAPELAKALAQTLIELKTAIQWGVAPPEIIQVVIEAEEALALWKQ